MLIEEGVEKALLQVGYEPKSILSNRAHIRDSLFYPRGKLLKEFFRAGSGKGRFH